MSASSQSRPSPATFYMHAAGPCDPEKMAAAIREAFSSESKTPFDPRATATTAAPTVDLDTESFSTLEGDSPDLEFRESFTWRPPLVAVDIFFWADEAVEQYWFGEIEPCQCDH
jgi:hypothetical protein